MDQNNFEVIFKVIFNFFTGITFWNKEQVLSELRHLKEQRASHIKSPEEIFTEKATKFNSNNHPCYNEDIDLDAFIAEEAIAFLHRAFSNVSEYMFTITVRPGFPKIRELMDAAIMYLSLIPSTTPSITLEMSGEVSRRLAEELILCKSQEQDYLVLHEPDPPKGFILFTFQVVPAEDPVELIPVLNLLRNTLNDTLRNNGLTYTVEINTSSPFYQEITISITCEPHQTVHAALEMMKILYHYGENGFNEDEVHYANKISLRHKLGVRLTTQTASALYNNNIWNSCNSIVVMVPNDLVEEATNLFKKKKRTENKAWDWHKITFTIGISASVFLSLGALYLYFKPPSDTTPS